MSAPLQTLIWLALTLHLWLASQLKDTHPLYFDITLGAYIVIGLYCIYKARQDAFTTSTPEPKTETKESK